LLAAALREDLVDLGLALLDRRPHDFFQVVEPVEPNERRMRWGPRLRVLPRAPPLRDGEDAARSEVGLGLASLLLLRAPELCDRLGHVLAQLRRVDRGSTLRHLAAAKDVYDVLV